MAVSDLQNPQGFHVLGTNDAHYTLACQFVADQYRERLGCTLTHFYPRHACLFEDGQVVAVAGLRDGAGGSFFLEQYLDAAVHELLFIDRVALVEIGGFAAGNRFNALILMKSLAEYLFETGFLQVVCTANRPIRGCLKKLGIQFSELGTADATRLEPDDENWGSYYETAPLVLAGSVETGVLAIRSLMESMHSATTGSAA